MRFVFMDEAGTAENEPVTVVVGLIVDADRQLKAAEGAVAEVLGAVPEHILSNPEFGYHSTEIWGDERWRDGWSMSDRLALLKSMMSLARRLEIPISLSMVRRTSPDIADRQQLGLSKAQWDHLTAFMNCIAAADRYIRNYAQPNEVGAIIAEDVPEMRRFLALAPKLLRQHPATLRPEHLSPTEADRRQGFVGQSGDIRVTRIRDSIHFAQKADPLLFMADAVAFGFRRLLAEQSFGADFCTAILGGSLNLEDFRGPSAFDLFYGHPRAI